MVADVTSVDEEVSLTRRTAASDGAPIGIQQVPWTTAPFSVRRASPSLTADARRAYYWRMLSDKLVVSSVALGLAAVLGASATAAFASDVRGSWQMNLGCGFQSTATQLLALDGDPETGTVSGAVTDCGTFEVPGAIRRATSCTATPFEGTITGADFALPAAGARWSSDMTFAPLAVISCAAATRIEWQQGLRGTVEQDESGRASAIRGVFDLGAVRLSDGAGTCFEMSNAPDCDFDLRRNDVPVGSQVTVSPRANTTVTFETVTQPGVLSVMPLTQPDADVPARFQVLSSGTTALYYDVHTSATIAGRITACFPYRDDDGDGIVDWTSPPLDEDELAVLHAESGEFVDRTLRIDTDRKVVCAETTSLSQLTVAYPPRDRLPAGPPDLTEVGRGLLLRRRAGGREVLQFASSRLGHRGTYPALGTGEDPRQVGASIDLFSRTEGGPVRFEMPATGWRADPGGTVFRFTNRRVSSSIRKAVFGGPGGFLRISGNAVGLALAAPQEAVAVRVQFGTRRVCAIYPKRRFKQNRPGLVVARRGESREMLDCADKRLRWGMKR